MTKKVQIDIVAKDKTKRAIDQSKKGLGGLKTAALAVSAALATVGGGRIISNLVATGKEVESLRTRFKFLFGSLSEGNKAFDNLAKFAGRVPFSLEEISLASGNLAVVSKDATDLSRVLKITGNVAAVTGLDFQTTASQIQRAFSGGIAAADVFREKGVRALLGFKQGASVSIEETVERFEEVFGSGGKFGQATDELAKTFEGTVSMLGDKLFTFKNQINEVFFEELKKAFGSLNTFFEENEKRTQEIAQAIGTSLASAVKTTANAVIILKDNFETLKFVFSAIIAFNLAKLFFGISVAIRGMTTAMIAFNSATSKNLIFGGIAIAIAGLAKFNSHLEETKHRFDDLAVSDLPDLGEQLAEAEKQLQAILDASGGDKTKLAARNDMIQSLKAEISLIKDAQEEIKKTTDLERLRIQEQARINSLRGKSKRDEITAGKDLQAVIQSTKTELELLEEKHNQELKLVNDHIKNLEDVKLKTTISGNSIITEKELELLNQLNVTKLILEQEFSEQKKALKHEEIEALIAEEERLHAETQAIRSKNFEQFKAGKFAEIDMSKVTSKDTIKMARHTLQEGAKINKELFRLNQALNIGEAIMNTAAGITAALKVANIPLAIAIGAMGAVQVATIASQQPPAQFGGSRQQGTPFLVGERGPELFTPVNAGTVTPNHQLGDKMGSTTVNFNINTVSAKGFNELLNNSRGMIVNMINSAVNEKGRTNLI
tara:strand:- start:323 stop:2479 length:2157 start_codon:yes stop_codon:yes gene_type:complete